MAEQTHRRPPGPSTEEEPERKKAKPQQPPRVALNPADCNLDFDVGGNGLEGCALHEGGFAYCWSGARATVGITGGKYCFACKVVSEQKVEMEDTPPDQQHLSRIGISRGDDPVGNLGESSHSFGFGGTGKFSTAGKFSDYGQKFGVGDVVLCAVDLEDRARASIGFAKNGQWLGTAWKFDAGPAGHGATDSTKMNITWASAFFPHILLKNVIVEMQFSAEDGLFPMEGFKPWSSAIDDGKAVDGPFFSKASECEVMMMVGLPASGKTTWSEKWVKEHLEKRYILLGTNLALDQMKVPGLLRKQNYGERFERLMDRATKIFNTLLSRASKRPRNYILDQTNVYRSARKRKLREFSDYKKVAVVMFPTPEELKDRAVKRFKEMGKEVPAEAVNEMLANFVLPTSKGMIGSDEPFDEVIFPELGRADAQRFLEEMKRELKTSKLTGSSPYSRQSSVQSFSSPLGSDKAFKDSSAHFASSHAHDYRSPPANRVSRSGSYGTPDYLSRASLPCHGSYSDHGSASDPRGSHVPYGFRTDQYDRAGLEANSFVVSEHSPYGRRESSDAQMLSDFEKSAYAGRYGYQDSKSTLPDISHNAQSGHAVSPVGMQVPRYPFDRYGSSFGTPISHGGSYGGPRIPQPVLPPREVPYEHHGSTLPNYGLHSTPPPNSYDNRFQPNHWNTPRYPSPGYPSSGSQYR